MLRETPLAAPGERFWASQKRQRRRQIEKGQATAESWHPSDKGDISQCERAQARSRGMPYEASKGKRAGGIHGGAPGTRRHFERPTRPLVHEFPRHNPRTAARDPAERRSQGDRGCRGCRAARCSRPKAYSFARGRRRTTRSSRRRRTPRTIWVLHHTENPSGIPAALHTGSTGDMHMQEREVPAVSDSDGGILEPHVSGRRRSQGHEPGSSLPAGDG